METQFYRRLSPFLKGEIRISPVVEYDCGHIQGKDSNLIKDNLFEISEGKKFYDVLPFMDGANFAISERFREILELNGITGWSCFPIIIKGAESQKYYCFQVLSNAGPIINLERLNNYEDEFVDFDINTWDGCDLFTLEETGILGMTVRVKEILEKAKITNIEILPL